MSFTISFIGCGGAESNNNNSNNQASETVVISNESKQNEPILPPIDTSKSLESGPAYSNIIKT